MRVNMYFYSTTFDGMMSKPYHARCYFKKAKTKAKQTSDLEGWRNLRWRDQNILRRHFGEDEIPGVNDGNESLESLVQKWKSGNISPADENELEWKINDSLADLCTLNEVRELLIVNDQANTGGENALRRRCAQGMILGALERCPRCNKGQLHFDDGVLCLFFFSLLLFCSS